MSYLVVKVVFIDVVLVKIQFQEMTGSINLNRFQFPSTETGFLIIG